MGSSKSSAWTSSSENKAKFPLHAGSRGRAPSSSPGPQQVQGGHTTQPGLWPPDSPRSRWAAPPLPGWHGAPMAALSQVCPLSCHCPGSGQLILRTVNPGVLGWGCHCPCCDSSTTQPKADTQCSVSLPNCRNITEWRGRAQAEHA